jgi:uncharacterized membrane protein
MRLHGNAALTPKQRLRLARRVVDEGWSLAEAAAAAEVSERTASKSGTRLGGDAAETPPFNAVATAAPRSSQLRGRVSWLAVAFVLTRIALFVLTFALRLLTPPLSGVFCVLTFALCLLALVFPPSLVLKVAVGTARLPQLAKVGARFPQLVP